jgi:hypothetical protein
MQWNYEQRDSSCSVIIDAAGLRRVSLILSARKERASAQSDEEKTVPIETTNQNDDRQERRYILLHQGGRGDFCLVGPFKSQSARSEWGTSWQHRNGDDPCWMEVELETREGEAFYSLPIHTPDTFLEHPRRLP